MMPLPKSIALACGGLLLSFTRCSWLPWGEREGSLCQGEEVDLQSIAPDRSLAGWWALVPDKPSDTEKKKKSSPWKYMKFDGAFHLRALVDVHPRLVDRDDRNSSRIFFGCQDYLDYPLVEGGSNRSPAESRNTIKAPRGGCSLQEYPLSPDLVRTLMSVKRSEQEVCLIYRSVDLDEARERARSTKQFCFSYDRQRNQIKLSYAGSNNRFTSWFFDRMPLSPNSGTSSPEEEPSSASTSFTGQDGESTGMNSQGSGASS